METRTLRQTLVWGGLLIAFGVVLLVETVADLSPWIWIALLFAGALVTTALYLADRSDWPMMLTAYILWAIALLILLVTLNILREEAVAVYCLLAIALPFGVVYYQDRSQWWALIPAYVMLAVGSMVGLIGLGILQDSLIASWVLLAIALPFFVVYVRDRSQWWPLIPGGILAAIGISFLIVEGAFAVIGGLVLLLLGAGMLFRAIIGKAGGSESQAPPVTGPETDGQVDGHQE